MIENNVLVSVVCLTYNHEKYITKCIESLINQKTTFNYEIVIHDDCSTDGTTTILKEYKKKYQEKISLILQETNQYSKGIHIFDDIVMPVVRGEYIAICEGDDYWIDMYKLEKQVVAMKSNPNCWISAHGVKVVDESGNKTIGKIEPNDKNCIFSVEQVIDGDGGFVGTNSLLFRKDIYKYNYQFRRMYSIDYFLQIMGALHGGMIYLSEDMTAYRSFSDGSWSSRMMQDKQKFCEHYSKIIATLQKLDDETEKVYHTVVERKIYKQEIEIFKLNKQYKELVKDKKLFAILSLREKMKVLIMIVVPWISDLNKKRRTKGGK